MIVLTRFDGTRMVLNDQHIERVDITPDTVITLMNGDRFLVRESAESIVEMITEFHARISQKAVELSKLSAQLHDGSRHLHFNGSSDDLQELSSTLASDIEDAEIVEDLATHNSQVARDNEAAHGSED